MPRCDTCRRRIWPWQPTVSVHTAPGTYRGRHGALWTTHQTCVSGQPDSGPA